MYLMNCCSSTKIKSNFISGIVLMFASVVELRSMTQGVNGVAMEEHKTWQKNVTVPPLYVIHTCQILSEIWQEPAHLSISAKTGNDWNTLLKFNLSKGQLISKCLLGVIVSTKKPMEFL